MFNEDIWLTKVLGISSFKMTEPSLGVFKDSFSFMDFVYVKLEMDELETINHLIRQGFSIIETNIILKSDKINLFENKEIQCRFARKDDEKKLKIIASESLNNSRFHVDKKIPNEKANYLKSEWVSSFFKGLRGDWMITAKYGKQICGFLLLIKDENNNVIIDLIAVKNGLQGKGIGRSMISYAYRNCIKGKKSFLVGTQLKNINSVNFYQHIGFKIKNFKHTLHYHRK